MVNAWAKVKEEQQRRERDRVRTVAGMNIQLVCGPLTNCCNAINRWNSTPYEQYYKRKRSMSAVGEYAAYTHTHINKHRHSKQRARCRASTYPVWNVCRAYFIHISVEFSTCCCSSTWFAYNFTFIPFTISEYNSMNSILLKFFVIVFFLQSGFLLCTYFFYSFRFLLLQLWFVLHQFRIEKR